MEMSASIKELAIALVRAKANYKPLKLSGNNPYFNSKYSTAQDIEEACGEAINKQGLTVCQFPIAQGESVGVGTLLLHESGEYIKNGFTLPVPELNAQKAGSCITYCKRYALKSILGVHSDSEDDDANSVSESAKNTNQSYNPPAKPYNPPTNQNQVDRRPGQITEKQVWRLYKKVIPLNNSTIDIVNEYIRVQFDLQRAEDLHYKQYEQLCDAIENKELSVGSNGAAQPVMEQPKQINYAEADNLNQIPF